MVPLAYLVLPHVDRHLRVRQLASADPGARDAALGYVLSRAGQDPRIAIAAIGQLPRIDDHMFAQTVAVLDTAAVWDRTLVPDNQWLRWIELLSLHEQAEARISAAQIAAETADLAHSCRIVELLKRLITDLAADVRFNTLAASTELAGTGANRTAFTAIIAQAVQDPEPTIARHAWIVLGLLGSATEHGDLATALPTVIEPMLWAAIKSQPELPQPVIDTLNDSDAVPAVRAAAAYALHLASRPEAIEALLNVVDIAPQLVPESDLLVTWRAILSLPKPDPQRKPLSQLEEILAPYANIPAFRSPLDPIALAAIYRFGIANINPRDNFLSALARLATVEGQPGPEMVWPIASTTPNLLAVMTTAITRNPIPDTLYGALTSPTPTLRDLACMVSADRLSAEQVDKLVRELLTDFNDNAKISGAILSGLTGAQVPLLIKKEEAEDIWSVRQLMRLGLWMQGLLPELKQTVPGLLTRDDLPVTTVLLGMLHHNNLSRGQALDYLLNPRGEPSLDLVDLFDQQRWWYVLRRYLPPDAPPFWVWADPDLEKFQIEVLRNWALLNRYRMASEPNRTKD